MLQQLRETLSCGSFRMCLAVLQPSSELRGNLCTEPSHPLDGRTAITRA
jgi:hypothetical protein